MSKKKIVAVLATILAILIIAFIIDGVAINGSLTVSEYTLKSDKISNPIRIVLLSDLHNSEFAENNEELINLTKEQSPDLIFMVGDMLNSGEDKTEIAVNLVEELSKYKTVYFSLGNHEKTNSEKYGVDMYEIFTSAGAKVLDFNYEDVTINEQKLRIGGVLGYCMPEEDDTQGVFAKETEFMKEFQSTDNCKLLLCHIPVSFILNTSLDDWDVDYVFSGHLHGGQVVLPFVGGLFAPEIGKFPGKTVGVFESEDKKSSLIVTSGLGTTKLPRFNNPPEIAVIDIVPN